MSIVPLSELKEQLNLLRVDAAKDAELQRKLDAAEAHVATLVGPLGTDSRTVTARLSGDQLILPVTRLTGVAAVRDPDGQVVTLDADAANLLSGIVRVPYRRAGQWEVDVASGATDLEPDIREAIVIIAAHLYETQRTTAGAPGASGGPVGFLIPRRAEMLLAPHLLDAA